MVLLSSVIQCFTRTGNNLAVVLELNCKKLVYFKCNWWFAVSLWKVLSVKWNVFFCFIPRLYNSKRWTRIEKGNYNLELNKLLLIVVVSCTPFSQFSHSFPNRCMDIFAQWYNFIQESSYKIFGLPKFHLNAKINDFYNRLGKIAHTHIRMWM